MDFLLFLQDYRNAVLDEIALLVTKLGEETVVVVVICALYWCISKKDAMRIGFTYFISGLLIQTLKIIYMIKRPWILNSALHPVEKAKATATGYSFPSGHTQSASALYGNLAYLLKNKWIKVIMCLLIVAVAFSRMYLGVHTPLDVSVSMCISVLMVIVVNYLMDSGIIYKVSREAIAGVLMAIPVLMITYGLIRLCNDTIDLDNLKDFLKSAGAAMGFSVGWYLEGKYLNFDETAGDLKNKIARLAVGAGVLLGVKEGLKHGLKALLNLFLTDTMTEIIVSITAYGLVVFFAIYLYPLIFDKINKKLKESR